MKSRIEAFIQKLAFLAPFYFLHGNADHLALIEIPFSHPDVNVFHKKVISVGEYEIIGAGGATGLINNPAFSETQLEENLREVYASVGVTPDHQILVTHEPPYNTALDFNLRHEHVGSRSVRWIIEEKQPLLALCGHIHEARGVENIGITKCVNAGAVMLGKGVEITIDGTAIEVHWLDF
ncbi:MAG: metallophosphoesterase [Promethearchaeota archaeon CR_4]|nr:MAG: metallophosphoesterase [Candidatus Lokiarchaeota archaeon CR_4]